MHFIYTKNVKLKCKTKCERILSVAFTSENCPTLAKFKFKIFNNKGMVVSEFKNNNTLRYKSLKQKIFRY